MPLVPNCASTLANQTSGDLVQNSVDINRICIMAKVEKEGIREAFDDVRNDNTATTWLVCKYNESGTICVDRCGDNYDEFLEQLGEDDRAFAFVRVIMGDELSKRAKFAFITWTGPLVGGLKKAKMGTDKSEVKKVIVSFAAEINAGNKEEVALEEVKEVLMKAGGANYGTGQRD